MRHRGHRPRLRLEPHQPLDRHARQGLDRQVALELQIAGQVDHPHARPRPRRRVSRYLPARSLGASASTEAAPQPHPGGSPGLGHRAMADGAFATPAAPPGAATPGACIRRRRATASPAAAPSASRNGMSTLPHDAAVEPPAHHENAEQLGPGAGHRRHRVGPRLDHPRRVGRRQQRGTATSRRPDGRGATLPTSPAHGRWTSRGPGAPILSSAATKSPGRGPAVGRHQQGGGRAAAAPRRPAHGLAHRPWSSPAPRPTRTPQRGPPPAAGRAASGKSHASRRDQEPLADGGDQQPAPRPPPPSDCNRGSPKDRADRSLGTARDQPPQHQRQRHRHHLEQAAAQQQPSDPVARIASRRCGTRTASTEYQSRTMPGNRSRLSGHHRPESTESRSANPPARPPATASYDTAPSPRASQESAAEHGDATRLVGRRAVRDRNTTTTTTPPSSTGGRGRRRARRRRLSPVGRRIDVAGPRQDATTPTGPAPTRGSRPRCADPDHPARRGRRAGSGGCSRGHSRANAHRNAGANWNGNM